jgi:hypothetical protein
MSHPTTTVALRDTPPAQCTRTPPPRARAASMKEKQRGKWVIRSS